MRSPPPDALRPRLLPGLPRHFRWAALLALALAPIAAGRQGPDRLAPDVRAALAAGTDSVAVWVYLDPEAARSDLPPALGARALERRRALGVRVGDDDRPLDPAVLARLEAAGARLRHASRWLRAASAWVDAAAAERLAALPEVRRIERVATLAARPASGAPGEPVAASGAPAPGRTGLPAPAPAGGAAAGAPAGTPLAGAADSTYGANLAALEALGVPGGHALGYSGLNVRIAILGTGFSVRHEALGRLLVRGAWDFVHGDSVVSEESGDPQGTAAHGTWLLSLAGALLPGRLVGPAYNAEYLLAKVDEDLGADTRADEDRWVAALEWADSAGADVVLSGLAFRAPDGVPYGPAAMNGDSTATTRAADAAAARGILVVAPTGNGGSAPGSLGAPADGDSVLAVGALDSTGAVAPLSGRGPTADGRAKPDVVARGMEVTAAAAVGPGSYNTVSGTEMAASLVAGAAAMVREAWPSLDAEAVRRALILSTGRPDPSASTGYGTPSVAQAILLPAGMATVAPTGVSADTIRTLAPIFGWSVPLVHPKARPVRYRLELATDPAFGRVVYQDTVLDGTAAVLKRPLRPADALWWRVTAETAAGPVRTVNAPGVLVMPRWVRLEPIDTVDHNYITAVRPRLRWTPIEAPPPLGPFTYEVQVLDHSSGEPVQRMGNLREQSVRVPVPLEYNISYRWRVIAHSAAGVADTVESVAPFVVTSADRPPATLLYQNFPNPFPAPGLENGGTRIWFDLDRRTAVELAVFDLRGRLVRRLIPASPSCGRIELDAGLFGREGTADPCLLTSWDGRDDQGRRVEPGVYLLRLVTSTGRQTRKVLFLPP